MLEAAKINGQVAGRLIAGCGIFVDALLDDAFEFEGDAGIEGARRDRRAVQDGIEDFGTGKLGERTLAGSHFVQDEPGGEEIGARIKFGAENLFGSHVGNGAGDSMGFQSGLRDRFGLRNTQFGEAEVEYLEPTFGGQEQVRGFQISMNDGAIMGGGEAVGELNGEGKEVRFGEGTWGEGGVERVARNEFHDEEIGIALGVEIVDGGDVGVIQLGESAGFVAEAVTRGFIGESSGRENLDGHIAIEARIVGEVNNSHAAAADSREDSVVTENGTDERV